MKLSLIMIFVPVISLSQTYSAKSGGTFIISGIAKDGIVVAADSRDVVFEHGPGTPVYAWHDSCQKIFRYKNIFIEAAGQYDYEKYTFFGLLTMFEKQNKNAVNAKNFYKYFSNFLNEFLTKREFDQFKNNMQIIISGYVSSQPCIYFYDKFTVDSAINSGFKCNELKDNKSPVFKNIFDTLHLLSSVKFLDNFIQNYLPQSRGKFPAEIGGPTSIGIVKPNGQHFEAFQTSERYVFVKEAMLASLSDKRGMQYRSERDSIAYKKAVDLYISNHP